MRCPLCKPTQTLVVDQYEGWRIWRCPRCRGVLAGKDRVESIKRTLDKSLEELVAESQAEGQSDSRTSVRCPRCGRDTGKVKLRRPVEFHIDACAGCGCVWFDGGELALLQLHHQSSDQQVEREEMQRRWREMTPEQRAEYEARLAALPEGPDNAVSDALGSLLEGVAQLGIHHGRVRRRGLF